MTAAYHARYPAIRLRRTRSTPWSRALHRETTLTPADLIWPLFVTDGVGVEQPVSSLPGVSRWSLDGIAARAKTGNAAAENAVAVGAMAASFAQRAASVIERNDV